MFDPSLDARSPDADGRTVLSGGPSKHPNAVHRRDLLAFVNSRRIRRHDTIVLAKDVRAWLRTYHARPDDPQRLHGADIQARIVGLLGKPGITVLTWMRKPWSFAAFENAMLAPRYEEQEHQYNTERPPELGPRNEGETLTDFHAEQRLVDVDEQDRSRRLFAEFLEGRAGKVNPWRIYREWLKEHLGSRYRDYVHIRNDIKLRLGSRAAVHLYENRGRLMSRKQLALLMRAL